MLSSKLCIETITRSVIHQVSDGYSFTETVIDHYPGQEYFSVSTGERRMKNRLRKLREQHPEEVICMAENTDGSVYYHVPVSYVQIRPPRKINMSDEQRAALAERMRNMNASADDDAEDELDGEE